jgi:hypothetical protein
VSSFVYFTEKRRSDGRIGLQRLDFFVGSIYDVIVYHGHLARAYFFEDMSITVN